MAPMRLFRQKITASDFTTPAQVVQWLVAMQAQEYAQAKWAIGLRGNNITDSIVEQAMTEGSILRTHVMRPTWHFVTPQDIRWLQELTSPRVQAFSAYYYKLQELDSAIFKKSNKVFSTILRDGNFLTRDEIKEALAKVKIKAQNERLAYILINAELQNLICSGPRRGKQFTYALLDERVPPSPKITRNEALLRLTLQYFTSRGPATVHDFSWWSGLTITDCREGINQADKALAREMIDGQEYFLVEGEEPPLNNARSTFLMPDYDEFGIAYKDRSALAFPGKGPLMEQKGVTAWSHWIIVDGRIRGTWKPVTKKDVTVVEHHLLTPLNKRQQAALSRASRNYMKFISSKRTRKK